MALTIVVPSDNLDQLRLKLYDLLPAFVPHVVSTPKPVLAPLRKVGVEPRSYGHHIRFCAKHGLPALVLRGGYVVGAGGPSIPREGAIGGTIRQVSCEARRAKGRPVWNEEATC